ncbi:component of IIS longevity pathway SMK-1-domain-containing protein [Polychytrium aggregatum]|uniref:component of IIS longevity pathway SMK-1-domain-containing protein n=1 Tax=Polychytrium aggregatum TaxID=110093 RepID=UPI0022FEA918|nr:component of IIS longevity pathway SMK-1-domain-containing protein [Polychytrium aggregatum]KAI9183762.1 component of IIS longevity pathway SMK-1-domain-containing protein [Polychytrium aggregatum]
MDTAPSAAAQPSSSSSPPPEAPSTSSPPPASLLPTRKRVKVYQLDTEGQWIDKGTGHVACVLDQELHGMCFQVKSEEDASVVLLSRISPDSGVYQRQQDTLIVWSEPSGEDYALSFQEAQGCQDIWEELEDIQRTQERLPAATSLPDPTLGNLKVIESFLLQHNGTPYGKEYLTQSLSESQFIQKLLPLLNDCEDLENTEDLYLLSSIIRIIIFLNDSHIYETILSDDAFMNVIGILEYDRDFPNSKASYRDYLNNDAKFKQVIPINNPEIESKIVQTYRVTFLKDVALARLLDDGTFSTLNSMIFFNHIDIVSHFLQNDEFLDKIFAILNSEDEPDKKKEVIMFLHELCGIAKTLQPISRNAFYRSLAQHGLFSIFEYTLGHDDTSVRLAATAILSNILDHDPSLVRSFCLAQVRSQQRPLIDVIIERFVSETDTGLRMQISEIIKVLLDTAGSETNGGFEMAVRNVTGAGGTPSAEAEEFLGIFYESYISKLTAPVRDLDTSSLPKVTIDETVFFELGENLSSLCHHICDLICFAVKNHSYRSKYHILGSKLLDKVGKLLKAKESYIRLSALKVFRTCVGMKDDFYNRSMVSSETFKLILTAFVETKARYNLLNSACLDLFEFIRKENMKVLICHVVENYRKYFDDVGYVSTFTSLVQKYEQLQEVQKSDEDSATTPSTLKRDGWEKQEDDEAYFNTDDDDDTENTDAQGNASIPEQALESTADSSGNNGSLVPKSADAPKPPSVLRKIEFVKEGSSVVAPPKLVDYPDDDDSDEEDLISSKRRITPKRKGSLVFNVHKKAPSPINTSSIEPGQNDGLPSDTAAISASKRGHGALESPDRAHPAPGNSLPEVEPAGAVPPTTTDTALSSLPDTENTPLQVQGNTEIRKKVKFS